MKFYEKTFFLLTFCGLLVIPGSAKAANVTLLSDTVAVFTLDITIRDYDLPLELPIAASSDVTYTDRVDTIGLTIEDRDGSVATTKRISALLLSRATIDGVRYQLPAGTSESFTLLVVAEFSEPITDAYTAKVTKLPYWVDGRRTTMHQNQLDELPTATLEATE